MPNLVAQFGKQAIIAAIVLAVVFIAYPSFILPAAGGFVVGAIAGNYFPALEARAEKVIADNISKGR